MIYKKIEIDILLFFLIEALFLLFFFKESILTSILGIIFGIILIVLTKNIKKNLFTKLILFISTIFLFILSFYEIINFISYNILKNCSIILITIPLIVLIIYALFKKYHTFIKTAEVSFYFFIFIKITSLILVIPKINFNNLVSLPLLPINYHFIFIGFTILYLYKSINYSTDYDPNKKRIIVSLINPLFIKLISILILSNTLFSIYKYPYVNYLKSIRYFDFIERIDGILSFEYLFSFFYLLTFLLFNIKSNMSFSHN